MQPVFEHVSFELDTDWKLGFTGRNGCGKSSILKLILGAERLSERIAMKGSIEAASGLKISFVSQDTSFLSGNLQRRQKKK